MKEKHVALVYNPGSGKGKAPMRASDFAARWERKYGTRVLMRETKSLKDIRIAARETYREDYIQVFMGGDGTISESLQGLSELKNFRGLDHPLGFLPGGSGNSFLRDFGITDYEFAANAFFEGVEQGSTIDIDCGIVDYEKTIPHSSQPGDPGKRIIFNIWGLGLIPDIAAKAITMRHFGELNYTIATLFVIMKHKPYAIEAVIDGKTMTLNANLLSVSNSRFTGGAMEIAPRVRVNDGKLFLFISEIESRMKLFGLFPTIFKGTHIGMDNTNGKRCPTPFWRTGINGWLRLHAFVGVVGGTCDGAGEAG